MSTSNPTGRAWALYGPVKRRWFKRSPITRDRCEVCGKQLRADDRYELTELIESDDLGGSMMTATYCKQHVPEAP